MGNWVLPREPTDRHRQGKPVKSAFRTTDFFSHILIQLDPAVFPDMSSTIQVRVLLAVSPSAVG